MKKTKRFLCLIGSICLLLSASFMNVGAMEYAPIELRAASFVNVSFKKVYFRNKQSGRYMDVEDAGGDGARVIQYHKKYTANQKWNIIKNGDAYNIIPSHKSYLSLYVEGMENANGSTISVRQDNSCKWKFEKTGTNEYRLLSSCSNYKKAAVVHNASMDNSAGIIQWTPNSSTNTNKNDRWIVEIIE